LLKLLFLLFPELATGNLVVTVTGSVEDVLSSVEAISALVFRMELEVGNPITVDERKTRHSADVLTCIILIAESFLQLNMWLNKGRTQIEGI
jgi:hypothetical protein